jgi:hypothetical protein
MAFWQNATASLVTAFSTAVLMLEESSELSHIHEVFIKPTSTLCESEAAANQQQVTFNQVRIEGRTEHFENENLSIRYIILQYNPSYNIDRDRVHSLSTLGEGHLRYKNQAIEMERS